jgi:hypothetical protein
VGKKPTFDWLADIENKMNRIDEIMAKNNWLADMDKYMAVKEAENIVRGI